MREATSPEETTRRIAAMGGKRLRDGTALWWLAYVLIGIGGFVGGLAVHY